MVERYVFIKLKDKYSNKKGRTEVVSEAKAVLPGIPGVLDMTVGKPGDKHAKSAWDVSLRLRFEGLEDVEPYLQHEEHVYFIEEFLDSRIKVKKAWNFACD